MLPQKRNVRGLGKGNVRGLGKGNARQVASHQAVDRHLERTQCRELVNRFVNRIA
jgi:hypothetical protein